MKVYFICPRTYVVVRFKLVKFRFDNCRLDLVAKQIACREYVSQNYVEAPASEHYYLRVAI